MIVEQIQTANLIPYARNARTHTAEQIERIAASIDEFGFTNPVLIDDRNTIIAGHGRVLAARRLGLDTVPCIRLTGLTDAQRRAYTLADNRLALDAGWDDALLESELLALADLDFHVDVTGFDAFDIDAPEGKQASDVEIKTVQTNAVSDSFWITVQGPLVHQARALQRLQEVMAEMPLSVELLTVPHE